MQTTAAETQTERPARQRTQSDDVAGPTVVTACPWESRPKQGSQPDDDPDGLRGPQAPAG